ncbi:hypothetical protein ACFVH7_12330 [Kitasatospora indigofera]|uniref:hypothetical protein n=1 Tax=Kitasatospora indigofera TaxID=67307 RepID=UPI0036290760
MTPPLTTATRTGLPGLVADLVEESEQVQALARVLDLPQQAPDPARLLSRNMLSALVHLTTVSASAAGVLDIAGPVTPLRLRALARLHSAQSSLLSATGSMATALEQLDAADEAASDPCALAQAARLRGAALLTSASAHIGAAAGLLRSDRAAGPPPART